MADHNTTSPCNLQQRQRSSASAADAAEPTAVRTRWTPKPEQILILESIFNSGMVNPSKDETVKIRRLLEEFGAVGDANVFYWFQNRRSRSRRRQRQLQASLMAADPTRSAPPVITQPATGNSTGALRDQPPSSSSTSSNTTSGGGLIFPCSSSSSSSAAAAAASNSPSNSFLIDEHSSAEDDLFSITRHMGFMESTQYGQSTTSTPFVCSSSSSSADASAQLHYQSGTIVVFIDGILSEVPSGPIDVRALFGPNVMLVHSSGELLPVNDHGILMQSLQMGESYFLVARPSS